VIPAAALTEIAAGRAGVYLVTVTAGGIQVRAATRPADVPWANGTPLQYSAVVRLEPLEVVLDVAALTGIGSYQSVRVEIADEDSDLVSLQLKGHPVAGAVVEVASWWPGQDWEQRVVVLRGRLRSPTLREGGRLSSFTATAIPAMGGGASVVDVERNLQTDFPTRPTVADQPGVLLPVVLGGPKNIPGLKVGNISGSDRLVLAGHWLGAGTVNIYEDGSTTAAAASPYTLVNGYADSGKKVAYISGAAASTFTALGALTADVGTGGGALRLDGAGATRTAADVLVWLLTKSGVRVDWPRCRRALTFLATWALGVYADDPAADIDVIAQRILPVLPLVALESGDGVWYHYVDLQFDHPEADLVEGQQLLGPAPGTGLDWSSEEDCVTSVGVRYGLDNATGDMVSAVSLDRTNDPLCALSRGLLGEDRAGDVLDGEVLWTATAARRAALHQARRRALPWGLARFVVEPEAAAGLREGSTVLITWSPWGLTRRPGILRSRYQAGDVSEITVSFAPASPARDGRL